MYGTNKLRKRNGRGRSKKSSKNCPRKPNWKRGWSTAIWLIRSFYPKRRIPRSTRSKKIQKRIFSSLRRMNSLPTNLELPRLSPTFPRSHHRNEELRGSQNSSQPSQLPKTTRKAEWSERPRKWPKKISRSRRSESWESCRFGSRPMKGWKN